MTKAPDTSGWPGLLVQALTEPGNYRALTTTNEEPIIFESAEMSDARGEWVRLRLNQHAGNQPLWLVNRHGVDLRVATILALTDKLPKKRSSESENECDA